MAAHAKYPAVHAQLLELARLARAEGLPFEEFWRRAMRPGERSVTWGVESGRRPVGAVVWPRDTADRNVALAATRGARDGWRRAYDQLPPRRSEAALERLRPELEALAKAAERADRDAAPVSHLALAG